MDTAIKNVSVKYHGGSFKLLEEPVPFPLKGQALIRVHYSTVNPYDRITSIVNKDEGFTLGCDGCGVIESVGEEVDSSIIGKKVAFFGGAYSKYTVKDVQYLVFFNPDFDLTKAANAYVNPLTVAGMFDIA
jgi:NADPH:quinone reductase-like Zn-dependent oxidoreductase